MKILLTPISYNKSIFRSFFPLLTADERSYVRKFTSFKRAYESLIARIIIKKYLGVDGIGQTKDGQPYLPDSPYYVSISHCEGYVMVAYSNCKIGVDLELQQPLLEGTEYFMSSYEQKIFKQEAQQLWLIKEAYSKWCSLGFRGINPQKIQCEKKNDQWTIQKEHCFVKTEKYGELSYAFVSSQEKVSKLILVEEKYL